MGEGENAMGEKRGGERGTLEAIIRKSTYTYMDFREWYPNHAFRRKRLLSLAYTMGKGTQLTW